MKLHEWLIKNNLSVAKLAKLAGISQSNLYLCLRYNRPMSGYVAMRLNEFTNNEVALEDLIDPKKREWKFDARTDLKRYEHFIHKKPA